MKCMENFIFAHHFHIAETPKSRFASHFVDEGFRSQSKYFHETF